MACGDEVAKSTESAQAVFESHSPSVPWSFCPPPFRIKDDWSRRSKIKALVCREAHRRQALILARLKYWVGAYLPELAG